MSGQKTELLRFTTAGSVDDGKSTLIGRLLLDSKSILEDQYQAIKVASERKGEASVNLALLTDGLKAEREQGITIDVAYRYFSTPNRKFIIADTPGHIQYTRNMVTGASTANVAIILVDARKGVVEQTKRHAILASLLQIPHLLVCINKMDLVEFKEEVFHQIKEDFKDFSARLDIHDIEFIPISALLGDNIVHKSDNMAWYNGTSLMYYLENVHINNDANFIDCRFPVQCVIRPMNEAYHDYRGYAGRVAGGVFKKGDSIFVLPSGLTSKIAKIENYEGELQEAFPPMSVTILLEDELDISRGDMIVREKNQPIVTKDVDLMICWFDEVPLQLNGKYSVIHTSHEEKCIVTDIHYKLDISSLHRNEVDKEIRMNDIARIKIRTGGPLFIDPFNRNKSTGSVIIVDNKTNATVAAGMIRS